MIFYFKICFIIVLSKYELKGILSNKHLPTMIPKNEYNYLVFSIL